MEPSIDQQALIFALISFGFLLILLFLAIFTWMWRVDGENQGRSNSASSGGGNNYYGGGGAGNPGGSSSGGSATSGGSSGGGGDFFGIETTRRKRVNKSNGIPTQNTASKSDLIYKNEKGGKIKNNIDTQITDVKNVIEDHKNIDSLDEKKREEKVENLGKKIDSLQELQKEMEERMSKLGNIK